MTTPTDPAHLADQLAASFGDGPPPAAPAATLEIGHRALARQRTLVVSATAAAVVAVGLTAALLGGSSSPKAVAPADEPSAAPSTAYQGCYDSGPPDCVEHSYNVSEPKKLRPSGRSAVELAPTGDLAKAKGVTISQQVPNPMGFREPGHSLGIAYQRDGGETTWALLTFEVAEDGSIVTGVSSDPAEKSFPSLQLWLDDQVALQNGDAPPLQFVEFGGGGGETLLPLDGVEILQQSADVELGESFAGPDDLSAVAEVRVGARRWYVLARTTAGSSPQYLPTAASVGGPTLEDFLAYAEQQYSEGGGGLR